jgi:hypothetical protein
MFKGTSSRLASGLGRKRIAQLSLTKQDDEGEYWRSFNIRTVDQRGRREYFPVARGVSRLFGPDFQASPEENDRQGRIRFSDIGCHSTEVGKAPTPSVGPQTLGFPRRANPDAPIGQVKATEGATGRMTRDPIRNEKRPLTAVEDEFPLDLREPAVPRHQHPLIAAAFEALDHRGNIRGKCEWARGVHRRLFRVPQL